MSIVAPRTDPITAPAITGALGPWDDVTRGKSVTPGLDGILDAGPAVGMGRPSEPIVNL